MPKHFTTLILIAMALGIVVGYACNIAFPDPKTAATIAGYISLVTDLFLRLIKMIIAPLVLSTLIVGITHMGESSSLGRVGAKTMGWFVSASLVSLFIGMVMVNILQPGVSLGLPVPDPGVSANLKTSGLTLKEFITHLVPRSIVEAMANNEILQIVVFSCFAGTAIAALDDRAPAIIELVEQVASIMLKITGYVMLLAPLVIFAALASTVATQGAGILLTYANYVGGFYISLFILWILLLSVAFSIMRGGIAVLLRA